MLCTNSKLPDDGCITKTGKNTFNVSFNISLEQSICAFSWINKRLDNKILFKSAYAVAYI